MIELTSKIRFTSAQVFFEKRWFQYFYRIIVLYIFSTIFKSFDLSFIKSFSVFGFRGQVFSLLYVCYGLAVWEGALIITRLLEKKVTTKNTSARLVKVILPLLVYGATISFIFGLYYGISDIIFFNRYEAWQTFVSLSYDLNFGTFLFYLMILAFNGIVYYYKGWKEFQVKAERLRRENVEAKYEALLNQIEPHFFFNSLSVLTNLVYKSADLSAEYITQLAKTYRYILDKKFEKLVTLKTELDFLESYLFLLKIRHDSSIELFIEIDGQKMNDGMLPPATLQMLVENAIKHNRFSVNEPLKIWIRSENDVLVIKNVLNKKSQALSTGIGLENIRKRYELSSDKTICVEDTGSFFIVEIPIIDKDESRHI